MLRQGKWIRVATPHEPFSTVAREALQARLGAVAHYLPLAACQSDDDIEHVHQLRVWTRRAIAAMRAYEEVLPRRRARRIEKRLKRIRRAAGDARDCDVVIQRLAQPAADQPDAAWAALGELAKSDRRKAQAPLVRIQERLRQRHFDRQVARLLRRVRWRGSGAQPSVGQKARQSLRLVVEPFFEAAAGDLSDVGALHRLRIRSKQLRYTMELVAGAFDATFRDELYPLVEQVQEKLGAINDHATWLARFESWPSAWREPSLAAPLDELVRQERSALRKYRRRFLQRYTTAQIDSLRCRFDAYLSRKEDRAT